MRTAFFSLVTLLCWSAFAVSTKSNEGCIYVKNPRIIKLDGKNCTSNLCVAEVECLKYGVAVVYQVSCLAKDGSLCPTAEDCIKDESTAFTAEKKGKTLVLPTDTNETSKGVKQE